MYDYSDLIRFNIFNKVWRYLISRLNRFLRPGYLRIYQISSPVGNSSGRPLDVRREIGPRAKSPGLFHGGFARWCHISMLSPDASDSETWCSICFPMRLLCEMDAQPSFLSSGPQCRSGLKRWHIANERACACPISAQGRPAGEFFEDSAFAEKEGRATDRLGRGGLTGVLRKS